MIEVMNAILNEPPPELPESVPGALRELVASSLEKNPARRFESAWDLAVALRSLAAGSSISGTMPILAAPPRKRRWVLPAIAGLAAVLAISLLPAII